MLLVLLGQLALGSSTQTGTPDVWVDTQLGRIRQSTVDGVCAAAVVVVGRITSVSSYEVALQAASGATYPRIMSDLTITVEVTLNGTEQQQVHLSVPGGQVGSEREWSSSSNLPEPAMGRRYMVAYTPLPQADSFGNPAGTPVVAATLVVDPTVSLPDQALQTAFDQMSAERCP